MPKLSNFFDREDQGRLDREFENVYYTMPEIQVGSAAPSDLPAKIGNLYIDNVNSNVYVSVSTSASASWIQVN